MFAPRAWVPAAFYTLSLLHPHHLRAWVPLSILDLCRTQFKNYRNRVLQDHLGFSDFILMGRDDQGLSKWQDEIKSVINSEDLFVNCVPFLIIIRNSTVQSLICYPFMSIPVRRPGEGSGKCQEVCKRQCSAHDSPRPSAATYHNTDAGQEDSMTSFFLDLVYAPALYF